MDKQYEHLFFDLDHTLWDFETNAKLSMRSVYNEMQLQQKGIDDFEKFFTVYIQYNDLLWERYRNGYIKQDELRWKRMFKTLLDFKIGSESLAKEMSVLFLALLPTRNVLFPYTIELLQYLQQKNYQMHLITNGFEDVQLKKCQYAGIDHFFKAIITSQASNSLKPNKEIFEYALQHTGATLKNSLMIGDNMEADIQGAYNVGMPAMWVNHINNDKGMPPLVTYTVHNLQQIKDIL
jgi:putative hydrolase of the HAD superfamily